MPSSPILTNINPQHSSTVFELETTLKSEAKFLILLSYFDQKAVSQKLSKIKNFFKIFFASHEVPKLLGQ